MYNDQFMYLALNLSKQAVEHTHGQPFGAVVVKSGEVIGKGYNQVLSKLDPTAHGEVEAIRDACVRLNTVDLSGCELYTSCEPCSICVATMYVVGIDAIYFASDLTSCTECFEPLKHSIYKNCDTDDLRKQVGMQIEERAITSSQHKSAEALTIIKNWASDVVKRV